MDTHAWDPLDADDKARILKGMGDGKAAGGPRVVDLEWSRRRLLPGPAEERPPGLASDEMDLYTLEMLFEEMEDAGVKGLVLGGRGDPLGHRSLESLLRRLSGASFRLCSLSTDGRALTEGTAERLAPLVRGRLELRFDTALEADLLAGPAGVRVARVLRHLKAGRGAASPCRVVVRVVLTPENCVHLGALTAAVAATGADAVAFAASRRQGDAAAFLQRRAEFIGAAAAAVGADAAGRIEALEAPHPLMADEVGALLPARSHRAGLTGVGAVLRTACVLPWLGLAVAPNGAAHPCRRALESGGAPVGNIHARPLERLWRGRPLRALRREARGGREAATCRACRRDGGPPLPCAADRAFCLEVDSLLRGGRERAIRFPERLRDREWSTVVLPLRHLWPLRGDDLQVRVDGVVVGASASGEGAVTVRFRPDDLRLGFHLVEVVDRSGRLLKARVVEKVG